MDFELINEATYQKTMQQCVLPALEHCKREGWMPSYNPQATTANTSDSDRFHYVCYESSRFDDLNLPGSSGRHRGVIIVAHGFTEFADKYDEIIWYFLLSGYTVCALDFWGHGFSGRGIDDPGLVWVDSYKRYVEDLAVFSREMAALYGGDRPTCLYAHSMGGGIGASLLEEHPMVIDRAVLSSPMIAPRTGVPFWLAQLLLEVLCSGGKGRRKVFFQEKFDPRFEPTSIGSASLARMQWIHQLRASNSLFQTYAASYDWAREALALSRQILKPALCKHVEAETLVFQAERDNLVSNKAQQRFVKQVRSGGCDISLIPVARAEHELYAMPNLILKPYITTILDFFNKP